MPLSTGRVESGILRAVTQPYWKRPFVGRPRLSWYKSSVLLIVMVSAAGAHQSVMMSAEGLSGPVDHSGSSCRHPKTETQRVVAAVATRLWETRSKCRALAAEVKILLKFFHSKRALL